MAKRFPFVVSSKELVKHLQSTTPKAAIFSSNMVFFSNAHATTRGGDPYVGAAKARDDDIGIAKPVTNNVDYRTKREDEGHSSGGVTGLVADAAKQGTEVLESVGDAAKETVDTAWDAAKKSAQRVIETTTAEADTNVVDTVEYRSAEDLMGQLGDGFDKKTEL